MASIKPVGQHGLPHGTVNHSLNFVDPVTGVATNHVEVKWQRVKSKVKAQHGSMNREMIPDYLAKFMRLQRFGESPFFHFMNQVATGLYVL